MCALTALWSVYCVISTKKSHHLQTGLHLRNRNAIKMSKWKGSYDSDWSEWVNATDFREELPMDQHAKCGNNVWNLTNHEKSGKISAPVQCQARFNVTFEENNFDILVIWMCFCDKGMAIPEIKFGFFLAFLTHWRPAGFRDFRQKNT